MIAESKAGGPTTAQGKAARHESRGRSLPVTVSTAKRTFATQKGTCLMDSGVGSQTTWEGPTNIGRLDTLTRQRHGLWDGVSI
jgi:hypothetical protein